ncbi:MAG: pyridoxine 5'-phosphate synthase [Deltaproteobacteria bacterium]
MIQLSVNLNKVALLRNSRGGDNPGTLHAARTSIEAGAAGITLHWRQDNRHARADDVRQIVQLCQESRVEFNLEGDPRPELVALALALGVTQLTLVPVTPGELTSDHGWDLPRQAAQLAPVVQAARAAGIRVAVFMDPDPERIALAKELGAERVEIYTEPYAAAFGTERGAEELGRVRESARAATRAGLGVNAGHDLTLLNLPPLAREVPEILEVSIGHALIADALYLGLAEAVRRYRRAAEGLDVPSVRTK